MVETTKIRSKSSCSFISFFIRDFSYLQKSGTKNHFFCVSFLMKMTGFGKNLIFKIWMRVQIWLEFIATFIQIFKIQKISKFSLGDYFEMSDRFPNSISHGRQIGGIVKISEIFNPHYPKHFNAVLKKVLRYKIQN